MRTLKNQTALFVDWSLIVSDESHNTTIDAHVLDLALREPCVLDFRFAAVLCDQYQIPCVGIWVSASLSVRVEANAHFWRKSARETEAIIRTREEVEIAVCRRFYSRSYREPQFYDRFVDLTPYWLPVDVPMDTTPEVDRLASDIISIYRSRAKGRI